MRCPPHGTHIGSEPLYQVWRLQLPPSALTKCGMAFSCPAAYLPCHSLKLLCSCVGTGRSHTLMRRPRFRPALLCTSHTSPQQRPLGSPLGRGCSAFSRLLGPRLHGTQTPRPDLNPSHCLLPFMFWRKHGLALLFPMGPSSTLLVKSPASRQPQVPGPA